MFFIFFFDSLCQIQNNHKILFDYFREEREKQSQKETVLEIIKDLGLIVESDFKEEGSFSLHHYNLLKHGCKFQTIFEELRKIKQILWEKYKVVRSNYIKENKK